MMHFITFATHGELPEWSPKGIPSGERGSNMYFTYILRSKSHGTFYYGHSKNLEKRISEHNKGYIRYTKGRRPWELHYFEEYSTKSETAKREYYFKSIEGYRYLKDK